MHRAELAALIRTVPDWPEPGVQFRDITPLLRDGAAFAALVEHFAERYHDARLDAVAGIEARGFLIGATLAQALGVGFIPVRKAGKLPHATLRESYALEYGSASVEIHVDAAGAGERVVLIDDLVATGGTLIAGATLLRRLGAEIVECAAVIDLPALGGATRVRAAGLPLFTLLEF